MSAFGKVYTPTGRGRVGIKEQKMCLKLQKVINDKIAADPNFESQFKPATTKEELTALFNEYCTEETAFEEIEEPKSNTSSTDDDEESNFMPSQDDFMPEGFDPLNDAEPIVRDYVLDGGLKEDNVAASSNTNFSEPTTYSDSFEIPKSREEQKTAANTSASSDKKKSKDPVNPANPSYVDIEKSDRAKSTKQLAKYIVGITCGLAEFGFVWFATKDITDDKLIEYETKSKLDLSLMITLENDVKQPIRDWFTSIRVTATDLAKFTKDEKDEMAGALYPVLMEKGVVLSPTQNALMVIGGIMLQKGAAIYGLNRQVKSVLDQLIGMKQAEEKEEREQQRVEQENAPQTMKEMFDEVEQQKKAYAPFAQSNGGNQGIKVPEAPYNMNEERPLSNSEQGITVYEEVK